MPHNRKVKVLALLPTKKHEILDAVDQEIKKYFIVDIKVDTPKNITKHFKEGIDILVLHADYIHMFENDFYRIFRESNKTFKFVLVKREEESTDFDLYKKLTDDIVYYSYPKNAVWKSIALLRRYWSTSSKPTTLIYKNIIADFVEQSIFVNNKIVSLTTKEYQLFKFFATNIGTFLTKTQIFKKVWGYEEDTSRAFDQMMFKLKNKIGKEYFTTSRTKGYRFE